MVKLPLALLAEHMQEWVGMSALPLGIILDLEAKRCAGAGAGHSIVYAGGGYSLLALSVQHA